MTYAKKLCINCENYRFDTKLMVKRGKEYGRIYSDLEKPISYCNDTLNVIFRPEQEKILNYCCWTARKPKQLNLFEI